MAFVPRLRFVITAILIANHWAQAGELLPYNPTAQQAATSVPSQPATKVAAARPVVGEQVYTSFTRTARGLDTANRDALIALFEKQLDSASQAHDAARAAHYGRLLAILRVSQGTAK